MNSNDNMNCRIMVNLLVMLTLTHFAGISGGNEILEIFCASKKVLSCKNFNFLMEKKYSCEKVELKYEPEFTL